MGPLIDSQGIADTFDGGDHKDAWAVVKQYRKVLRYSSSHPNKGSAAVATSLNLPRSRIRPWVDHESKPDSVHAIETARQYGWTECGYDDKVFRSLNTLVANVFSGGSISDVDFRPSFSLDRDRHAVGVLEDVGTGCKIVDGRGSRSEEARPKRDASVLGRVLVCLGAPSGPKSVQRLSLPAYLEEAPDDVREDFVSVYIQNRANQPPGEVIRIREVRNQSYLTELASLISDVSGGPVTISEKNLIISNQAAENLTTGS